LASKVRPRTESVIRASRRRTGWHGAADGADHRQQRQRQDHYDHHWHSPLGANAQQQRHRQHTMPTMMIAVMIDMATSTWPKSS